MPAALQPLIKLSSNAGTFARQLGCFLAQFKQMQSAFNRQLDTEVFQVQMDKTTAFAEAPIAVSRTGGDRLAELDPWVTNFRSAELSSTSALADGANMTERSVTAEQVT